MDSIEVDPWRRGEKHWSEQVPASVTDSLTPHGDECHTSTDRRMLWHLESFLSVTGTTEYHREKRLALYRYLCETCTHEWVRYSGDEIIGAHRQCLWCSDVEWEDPKGGE